ncbi:uncharacterized protein ARMOST_07672 [Armillaria ostoyae]|uniref:Glucose-methanol-choline oxidoreductase C-terminal domain-containing protein n=1 Tax=Armillaria ostoyae TaxID=47428 RepID=A0A284R6J5_ARMOS|nr:uncharacterized protein ARMOST_07672 [Armillaria ostoyae]
MSPPSHPRVFRSPYSPPELDVPSIRRNHHRLLQSGKKNSIQLADADETADINAVLVALTLSQYEFAISPTVFSHPCDWYNTMCEVRRNSLKNRTEIQCSVMQLLMAAKNTTFQARPWPRGNAANVLNEELSAGHETAHYELAFLNGLVRDSPGAGNYFDIISAVLCPLSRGNVTVNSSNTLDPPLIDPNYFSHPQDLAIMKYAIKSVKRFVNATVWDGYILEIATNTTDDDIRSRASSVYHAVGTASMSPVGADWGVVDPDLRMKHATGVRIVDASVLPFVPAGHTQAPVYAFAERAADLIKASWVESNR